LDDVRVAEAGDRFGLGAGAGGVGLRRGRRQEFDRDLAAEGELLGEVDHPHAAAAEFVPQEETGRRRRAVSPRGGGREQFRRRRQVSVGRGGRARIQGEYSGATRQSAVF